MKNFKNKFILSIIWIIILIIFSQWFIAYSGSKKDTNSYVSLIEGTGFLNESSLTIKEKYILQSGDKVVTKSESLAIIEWWDGSLTRLWENTKITVQQNQISKDYTDINISFDLLSGKTWSQVVSFMSKDSSFTQSFSGIEAGVRWTIFDVDLENSYIRVLDHEVSVIDKLWNETQISTGDILNVEDFSLINLSRFIRDIEDKSWTAFNKGLDSDYKKILEERLESSLNKNSFLDFLISKFSLEKSLLKSLRTAEEFSEVEKKIQKIPVDKKQKIYKAVLSEYQNYNFVNIWNYENYKRKVFFKKALILLSDDAEEIQRLIETTSYDLKVAAKEKLTKGVSETLELIDMWKQKIPDFDIYLPETNFDYLPENLKIDFLHDFWSLFESSPWKSFSLPENISEIEDSFQWLLDDTFWDFIK